jgi:hypothetical protein
LASTAANNLFRTENRLGLTEDEQHQSLGGTILSSPRLVDLSLVDGASKFVLKGPLHSFRDVVVYRAEQFAA